MSDPFLAEIRIVGFNFPPRGWAVCDGQLIPISQNTALFALLGTTYGGNGTTNFALPDLRDRSAVGAGRGPGLSDYTLGQRAGADSVTLLANQMPAHQHGLRASNSSTTTSPAGSLLAPTASGSAYRSAGTTGTMSAESIAAAGSSQPHNNRQPYLGTLFVIALQGIFPPRP